MRARVAALLAVAAILTVAAVPVAQAGGDKPSWRPGDFWNWAGTIDIPFFGPAPNVIRFEVVQAESLTLGTTAYNTLHTRQTQTITSFITLTTVTDQWYDSGTLALIRTAVSTSTSTYSPPAARWQFPVTNGKAWTVTGQVTTERLGGGPTTDTYSFSVSVTGEAELSLTLRTTGVNTTRAYRTFKLSVPDELGGGTSVGYYTDEIGNFAKIEHFNSGPGSGTAAWEVLLTEYRYTPPVSTLVLIFLPLIIILVIVVVIIAALTSRRKKPPVQAPVQQPQYAPQQPPQYAQPPPRP